MTKREIYENLIKLAETGSMDVSETELKEFCEKEIAALDKKAIKAKEASAKKKAAGDELTERVFAALTEDFQTVAEITAAIGDESATTAKVVYRLNALIDAGRAVKQSVTITGGEGQKKRKVQAYALAIAE